MSRFLLFFLLLISCYSYAQKKYTSGSKSAIKAFEKANEQLNLNEFDLAIKELNKAIEADDKFVEAHLTLGDVYKITHNYQDAKNSYKKALEVNPNFAPDYNFYLAETELKTGEYENAKTHLLKFLTLTNENDSIKKLAEKYLKDCTFSINAIKNPVVFKPENLGANVNTDYDEYMPFLTTDQSTLIFTRQINQNEDFYRSYLKNNQYSPAEALTKNINTTYNEGAQCISPDGEFLFFTGCNRPDGNGRCDIYVSQREGKGWSKPVNLGPPVNTKGWESQPSLSSDGRTLYFVSDRPGGYGSYDIWKSTLDENGKWSAAINLGPNVNTFYDEQSPFIHQDDKTLYFASNGWIGLGNKDLFISRADDKGAWSKPENLGYPINTYGEESGLTINSSGSKAYFSSNNFNGFGGMDIYNFDLPANMRPNPVNYVKGTIYDAKTNKVLDALIEITDLKNNTILHEAYSNIYDGEFVATLPEGHEYSLNVSKEGYLFYSENFALTKYREGEPFILKVPLQTIEVGNKVVLKNIFFDTNKFTLKATSQTELQKLIDFMTENPNLKVEILGHTDNVGDDKLNQTLSENRAKTVYNYLVKSGISHNRLTYKGYGKIKPQADNTSESGRAANRRTEFMITGK